MIRELYKIIDALPDDFAEQQQIIANEGQENGFVQGFRFAIRIMMDIL